MAKPTKGHAAKRAPSDEARLKREHINMLKRGTAIINNNNVDDTMFTWCKVSNNKYRIKGVGAQAYKLSRGNKDVIAAIKDRNWTRVASLVPFNNSTNIDYTPKKKAQLDKQSK